MRKILAILAFGFILSVGTAAAQDSSPQKAAAAADQPTVVTAPVEAAASTGEASAQPALLEMNMTKEGNVTLDFREADIRNVLKVLAYKSGLNIIAGPEVVGMVNIQLKDVPWEKALDVILSTYGYAYERRGVIIMVTTIDNMKKRREDAKTIADQEPITTETFLLNFSKAEDVVKTLEKMKTPRGSINFDQRTNSVIVSDVESNIAVLKEVVKKLDTVTPQVLIEARIIETGLTDQEKLGIQWPTTLSGTSTFAPLATSFPWSGHGNTYMNDAVTRAPLSWTTPSSFSYGTISISSLSAVLDMLKSRTDTNVISNPRIVTLDNQAANITVGNKFPLPKYTYSDTQDKLTISGWEYIEYGLTFNVTPHINGKGVVTLDIEPVIVDSSSSVAFNFGGGTATNVPVLTTESAKTNVMIRDGETLVIAGLIKDKKTKTIQKFPILGDLPIIGIPFRHKEDTVQKTELLIFLTPHIITPDFEPVSVGKK
jgi:type IV pilus assembly protein PilQ